MTDETSSLKLEKLKQLFKDLSLSVRDSLLDQKVQPYQLSSYLTDCYEDEPILKSTDSKIFRYIKEEFDDKESMDKFWSKMENYFSFFSFKLLKAVINSKYIDESIRQKFSNYEKEFQRISLDITKHYVGEENMCDFLSSDGTTRMMVKIEEKFTTYSDVHVRKFKIILASAIDVRPDHLQLISLRPGCTLLTYDALLHIEITAFPLQQEQENILKELGVIWIECGKYRFSSHVRAFLI